MISEPKKSEFPNFTSPPGVPFGAMSVGKRKKSKNATETFMTRSDPSSLGRDGPPPARPMRAIYSKYFKTRYTQHSILKCSKLNTQYSKLIVEDLTRSGHKARRIVVYQIAFRGVQNIINNEQNWVWYTGIR